MAGDFECLVRDIEGAEGPCVDLDGRVFMVGPNHGRVLEVRPDGSTRDIVKYDGIPAGLQLDRNGDLWCADMKRGILRIGLKGKLYEEGVTIEGKPIRGCNDCSFDSEGNLYVTAPAGSGADKPVGELFCRLRSGTIVRLDGGYQFCNGLAVSADDRTLIVAETMTKRLYAFDIREPGVVANKRHWGTLSGNEEGGPDGIDFDEAGYMLATNWGGSCVDVFDPAGQRVGRIDTPFKHPSNIHFTGPGHTTILITEHDTHGLWRTTWQRAGQRQYGWK